MISNDSHAVRVARGGRRCRRPGAFSLVELLTVIFIISLLIGVLIPSINSARNAAKKATTAKTIEAIKVGLEMFRNDNEKDFRQTNGYPPSFAHPKISGYDFDAYKGEFPFICKSESDPPVVYGAHWLPAMLMGADKLGYVKRSSVPTQNDLRKQPWLWYPEPNSSCATGNPVMIDRQSFYLDPGNTRLRATKDLPGRPPDTGSGFFPDWNEMNQLPVIVDAFDQPILYYVANKHGKTSNMVESVREEDNDYSGSTPQEKGVPFYFHQDNEGFTGTDPDIPDKSGWDFAGRQKGHAIGKPGDELTPDQLILGDNRETFARYIVDRNLWTSLSPESNPAQPLRPANADTFLLLSAGPDGRFGTNDDVSNLPDFPE